MTSAQTHHRRLDAQVPSTGAGISGSRELDGVVFARHLGEMMTPAKARELVAEHGGGIRATARAIGVSHSTIRYWLNPVPHRAQQQRAWAEGRHWAQRPENRKRRLEARRQWENTPAGRETMRMHQEARRRRAGAKQRDRRTPVRKDEALHISAEPFRRWLLAVLPPPGVDRADFLRAIQLDPSLAKRILDEEQTMVHIDTVDRALIAHGENLIVLYPDLFEEEE